jgi:hypothetical protein
MKNCCAIGAKLGLDRPHAWCDSVPPALDAAERATLAAAVARGGGAERRVADWPWSTQTLREGEVVLAFPANASMPRVHAVIHELSRLGIWRLSFAGSAAGRVVKLRANVAREFGS